MSGARRVLVVDDDSDWREYLRECLRDLGYEPVEAASGEEALASLERTPPEESYALILLDLNMPGMSGEDVVARLPDDAPRVVFVTSRGAEEVGGALNLNKGGHFYLPKG